jgi:hypothetical protein
MKVDASVTAKRFVQKPSPEGEGWVRGKKRRKYFHFIPPA